jgi:hypothetical protein
MRGLLCFLMSIHIYVYDEPMNELLPSTYGQAKRSNVLPVRYQNYPKEKKKAPADAPPGSSSTCCYCRQNRTPPVERFSPSVRCTAITWPIHYLNTHVSNTVYMH